MRPQRLIVMLLAPCFAFVACDSDSGGTSEPPTPAETTAAVNNSVQLALNEAAESFEFLNDSDLADELFGLLPGDEEDCGMMVPVPVDEFGEPMEDGEMIDSCGEDGEDEGNFDVDFKDAAKEMAEWVADDVLTESNVEEVAGNAVIYLLPTNLVCDALEGESDEGSDMSTSAAPPMDEDSCQSACGEGDCPDGMEDWECDSYQEQIAMCVESCMGADMGMEEPPSEYPEDEPNDEDDGKSCEEMFAEAPLRLRVTASGAGHKIDMLVGAKKSNPVSAFVAPTELAVELDVAGSMESLETLAEAAGEDSPELPKTLEGRVKLGLKKNAAESYTVALSVLQAIHVVLGMDDEDMSLKLGVSEPTIAITADGTAKALSMDLDLAAIDVSVPGSMFEGETCTYDEMTGEEFCESEDTMDGELALHLGGASVSMALTSGSDDDTITITNAGLGDSTTTVSYDGQQVIGLDLNPSHGRRMDISLTSLEEMMELAIDPALVLKVALNLANAPDMVEDAPEFMLDEEMTISLTGANPTMTMGDHGVRVESGTLLMTSTSTQDVVIEAGMCIEMGDEESVGEDTDRSDPGSFIPEGSNEESGGGEHPFSNMKAVGCE